jgi:hypothetical protein
LQIIKEQKLSSYINNKSVLQKIASVSKESYFEELIPVIVKYLEDDNTVDSGMDILEELKFLNSYAISFLEMRIPSIQEKLRPELREMIKNKTKPLPPTQDEKEFSVIRAIYFSKKNYNPLNATRMLRKLLGDTKDAIVISNENIGNDPHFGSVKTLEITYRIGNSIKNQSIIEGGALIIDR